MRTLAQALAILVSGSVCLAQGDERPWEEDLAELDLERLMQIEVTSVAGVAQPLQDTPAALFLIRPEDVRRGGHLNIPGALRMVPGMNVGQITSSIQGISARGFNDRFSTKLLVLIDGRAVYNDLFSGVFWEVQDVVLEDLDRIEVVRGPGATLWGANAVNGVVNVVTRSARETQGLLLSGGGGNIDQGFGTVRYGGKLGESAWFRVYGKYFNRDHFMMEGGEDSPDDWSKFQGGFRVDLETDADTAITVQGDAYDGTIGSPIMERTLAAPFLVSTRNDTDVDGGNVLARIAHQQSETAGWSLQAYYDRARQQRPGFFDDTLNTADLEFRHHFAVGERGEHALIWGAAYRYRHDETDSSFTLAFDPDSDTKHKVSAFVQDTIALVPDRVSLLVGSKFEHNDYTGFEIQPGGRLAWTPDERQTLWGGVSRAVRTPSRANDALLFTGSIVTPPAVPDPVPARLVGNDDLDSEELWAFEAGYRVRPLQSLTFDIAAFYNLYDDLVSLGAPTASPFDGTFSNDTEGETYGVEVAAMWKVAENWRLGAGYSFLAVKLHGLDESDEGTAPQNQFNLRSYLDLLDDLELNGAVYWVDNVASAGAAAYTRLDIGLTWRPAPNVEIAVWGRNLLDPQHVEFTDPFFVVDSIEVERSVYASLTLRF